MFFSIKEIYLGKIFKITSKSGQKKVRQKDRNLWQCYLANCSFLFFPIKEIYLKKIFKITSKKGQKRARQGFTVTEDVNSMSTKFFIKIADKMLRKYYKIA